MNDSLRPLPLWQNLLYFGIPSLATTAVIYGIIPVLVGRQIHPMWGFLSMVVPLAGLFAASLAAYRLEGRAWAWAAFKDRMRLVPMKAADWGWAALALGVNLGGYLGLRFTTAWLEKGLWSPPAALDKIFTDEPGVFAGVRLHGQWWVAAVYAGVLFFNIFGEELWWRGIIQPRQEAQAGRYAWVLQGVCWTLFHLFWAPDLIRILPGALMLAYAVQRRGNTWIAVVSHTGLNILGLVNVVGGILG